MNKKEVEEFLRTLCPVIFCKYCNENIPRQEIGHHFRQKYHIENLDRYRKNLDKGINETYEDLIKYHELHIIAVEYISQKHLSDAEYAVIQSLGEDSGKFFKKKIVYKYNVTVSKHRNEDKSLNVCSKCIEDETVGFTERYPLAVKIGEVLNGMCYFCNEEI